uniref:Zgc:158263 n=1 Tax=Oryzias sinensis TaxID=183150 RepID=A0A8C8DKX9_9TELE
METDLRLESSLWVNNRRCAAVLTGWHFKWSEVDKKSRDKKTVSVPVAELVGVEEGKVEVLPHKTVEDTDKDFTVFYVKRSSSTGSCGLLWRLGRTQFSCPSRVLRDQWIKNLRTAVQTHTPLRPHRLLVFINPFGGKKMARQIFHSLVAPLFELAGISSHVIVTERANQARDHLLKKDLMGFDGVVCVGGDGMFSEILHGVIGRTQQEAGTCENDPGVTLQPCPLHIGIIPDPQTACVTMDLEDFMTSEKHRWMGPLRYDYSGSMVYLSNRSYTGTVQYLPADPLLSSPRDNTRCLSGCTVCSRSTERLFPNSSDSGSLYSSYSGHFHNDLEGEWVTVEGRFKCVSLTCMSSSCTRSPMGLSPSAHLADGTGDLVLVWDTNPLSFLRFLYRHTSTDDQFDLPFVEVHRVKAVRFSLAGDTKEEGHEEIRELSDEMDIEAGGQVRSGSRNGSQQHLAENATGRVTTSEKKTVIPFTCCLCCKKPPAVSVWNCDGEILPFTNISCRIHGQLVRLYARGIEDKAAIHHCSQERDMCNITYMLETSLP